MYLLYWALVFLAVPYCNYRHCALVKFTLTLPGATLPNPNQYFLNQLPDGLFKFKEVEEEMLWDPTLK